MATLAQCEMFENGAVDDAVTIDGRRVALCSGCHRLLARNGRLTLDASV